MQLLHSSPDPIQSCIWCSKVPSLPLGTLHPHTCLIWFSSLHSSFHHVHTDVAQYSTQQMSRGIRVCSFLGRQKDHPTYLFTERHRNVMEQGPTCPTCHVQCRGETLLVGSRLVIKHSASLSNTKALCTLCAPPLVTAGEASACWGRKSDLAGEGWVRAQKQQSNESERK